MFIREENYKFECKTIIVITEIMRVIFIMCQQYSKYFTYINAFNTCSNPTVLTIVVRTIITLTFWMRKLPHR